LRVYSLTPKNRVAAVGLAVGVVGLGVLVIFVGAALLVALTAAGAVLGTGVAAYRWLRGGPSLPHREVQRRVDLDPALEVHAPVRVMAASGDRPVERKEPTGGEPPRAP
jgi:hypothetical protein